MADVRSVCVSVKPLLRSRRRNALSVNLSDGMEEIRNVTRKSRSCGGGGGYSVETAGRF